MIRNASDCSLKDRRFFRQRQHDQADGGAWARQHRSGGIECLWLLQRPIYAFLSRSGKIKLHGRSSYMVLGLQVLTLSYKVLLH